MIWFYEMLIMVAWQKGLHNRISLGNVVLSKVEQIYLLKDYLEFLYGNVHSNLLEKDIYVYIYVHIWLNMCMYLYFLLVLT